MAITPAAPSWIIVTPTLTQKIKNLNPMANNTERATGGDSQFGEVTRAPTSTEVKKLIGMMAASSVEACMSHHYYTIDGVIRRQKDGGSIGSDLTGEEARLYMLQWDDKFMSLCRSLG